ncbi:transposase [Streptomyces sp. NPDC002476]|uniref:IS110 family transposase n=1 Tax=Streptomyces sp. NPDC002476 TaxID=3364648 RepID=UPI003688D563
MTSVRHDGPEITGGVDTHGLTHHAAVIDSVGRHLADREFPATIRGCRDLLDRMRSRGTPVAVGVEGAGAYGAELARVLTAAGVTVIDQPDRRTRRMKGESDPIDAYAAAGGYVRHRVFFADEPTAITAGYRPCAVCLPEQYRRWKDLRRTRTP